jgi:ribonuclease HI
MDDHSLIKLIQKHLDVEKLVRSEPGLTKKDIETFFQRFEPNDDKKHTPSQPDSLALKLYIDGAARGNPGPAAVGCVVLNMNDSVLIEKGKTIGHATNNVAEYRALLYGLELVKSFSPGSVTIYSDSELLVKQMKGEYKTRDSNLKKLKNEAEIHLKSIKYVKFNAISRSLNKTADSLANRSLDLAHS